jgi:hypothetical protein
LQPCRERRSDIQIQGPQMVLNYIQMVRDRIKLSK